MIGMMDDEQRVKAFFLASPVSPKELKEVGPHVEKALTSIVEQMEEQGPAMYQRFQAQQKRIETQQKEDAATVEESTDALQVDPRSYQRALLEIAKKENTIVHLGTGTGKTFIALMLIQHYLSMSKSKQTVFLVPSVVLAYQQRQFLQDNLPEPVGLACANSQSHMSSKARVLVATHGAYLDLLRHYSDVFQLQNTDLLVLDECHNCTGNSSYAVIMRDWYHALPESNRPRVLGLTASPLINIKWNHTEEQLALQLAQLEKAMDCKIASMGDLSVSGQDKHFLEKQAAERVIPYVPDAQLGALHSIPNSLHPSRMREFQQLLQLEKELGPLVLQMYCQNLLNEIARNVYEHESVEQFRLAVEYLHQLIRQCEDLCRADVQHGGRQAKLRTLEMLLIDELSQTADRPVGVVFVQRRITALALKLYFNQQREQLRGLLSVDTESNASPHDTLSVESDGQFDDASEDEGFQFPELVTNAGPPVAAPANTTPAPPAVDSPGQFDDAEDDPYGIPEEITQTLAAAAKDKSNFKVTGNTSVESSTRGAFVRCCSLVRSPTQIFRSSRKNLEDDGSVSEPSLHDEDISSVLNGLRRGEYNVLVATSIVEEGVDVQACSFVAVFNSLTTIKSYIQMKGRARQKHAKFYLFKDTSGNGSPSLNLADAKSLEARVQEFVASQRHRDASIVSMAGHGLSSLLMSSQFSASSSEVQALESGVYEAEHGRVYLSSAKSLLYRYAHGRPIDTATRSSKKALQAYLPLFDEMCHQLLLPAYIGSALDLRIISLPERYHQRPKKEKQNMLALMACVRLHQRDLLSNRLLPYSRQDIRSRIQSLTSFISDGVEESDPSVSRFRPQVSANTDGKFMVYRYVMFMEGKRLEETRQVLKSKHRLELVTFEPLPTDIPRFDHGHRDFGTIEFGLGFLGSSEYTQEQVKLIYDFFTLILNARWKRRTRPDFFQSIGARTTSVVPTYAVGCIDANGNSDWSVMRRILDESRRSNEERINAAQSVSHTEGLAEPRLWCPLYDEFAIYVAYGDSGKTCDTVLPKDRQEDGVKTYRDFFCEKKNMIVAHDSPLSLCQCSWHLPSQRGDRSEPRALPENFSAVPLNSTPTSDYLKSVHLPPCLCMELPFAHAGLYLESLLLPQTLYYIERILRARAFVEYCSDRFPELGDFLTKLSYDEVLSVLTAHSCRTEETYEHLEWLGDGVLKLICTDVALRSKDLKAWVSNLHVGDLDTIRMTMCCNDRLISACKRIGFQQFILTAPLSRGEWTPSSLELHDPLSNTFTDSYNQNLPAGKVCADVIEALIGMVYLHPSGGYDLAMQVADELTVTIPWDREADYGRRSSVESIVSNPSRLVTAAESFSGYERFRNTNLVAEAFTHPTSLDPEVSSYQRLEWIGDAVLCLATREWIYKTFSQSLVGEMVLIEESMVSNQTLAFLTMLSGVHKYLRHHDQTLPARVDAYRLSVEEQGGGLWGSEPPKSIADIVEAVIGAVYLDGGLEAGLKSALKILHPVRRLFADSHVDPSTRISHPKRKMHELGGTMLTLSCVLGDYKSQHGATHLSFPTGASRPVDQQVCAIVQLLGLDVISCSDVGASSATNRACVLVLSVLDKSRELKDRFFAARSKVLGSQLGIEEDDDLI